MLFALIFCSRALWVNALSGHIDNDLASSASAATQSLPKRPNIVILFADDMGYGDLPINGHPTIDAPNLVRMQKEGATFTQWYSGSPLCTPSRAALLTGRLPVRSGMVGTRNGEHVLLCDAAGGLPRNETTFAEHLKSAGYVTAMAGKWHLGQREKFLPHSRGFDHYIGVPFSVDMGCPLEVDPSNCTGYKIGSCHGLPLLENNTVVQQPTSIGELSERYGRFAEAFIIDRAPKPEPFLLYLAFSHVHVSVDQMRQYAGPRFNSSLRGRFGDALSELDSVVGRVLDALRNTGVAKETLVWFTSDNGPWMEKEADAGSPGIFIGSYAAKNLGYTDTGKGSTWEGGVRMPAMVWWPGIVSPGSVVRSVSSTMDIFATSLSLAGVPLPSDRIIDGRDLSRVLLDLASGSCRRDEPVMHNSVFLYNTNQLFAVRHGSYKAHFFTKSGFGSDEVRKHDPPLLFNVEVDPSEALALDQSAHAAVLEEIAEAVKAHKRSMEAGVDQLIATDPKYAVCCDSTLASCQCGKHLTVI